VKLDIKWVHHVGFDNLVYDKHKAIWWVKINAGKVTTRDNFIKQQDIGYFDRKCIKRSWFLHKKLVISLWTWAFIHPNDVFYFQDANKVNGIHVPFTIPISIVIHGFIR